MYTSIKATYTRLEPAQDTKSEGQDQLAIFIQRKGYEDCDVQQIRQPSLPSVGAVKIVMYSGQGGRLC